MHNLYYELAQSHAADLHRDAAERLLADQARSAQAPGRRSVRSLFVAVTAALTEPRREAQVPAGSRSAPAAAGRPSST